ncbi:MAG: cupin domain-containing protein [Chloroflexi bacterium]|nr:cupin domain-containing protein [Chloroflexota bacterium]MBI2979319.1 cupin domain-containing protein [Chloroflexota bacterium]
MANFYDEWLRYWDIEQEERATARKCINEEDLEWIRTKQDFRAALLCAREIGSITSGVTMLAEIPRACHTGKHSHGEEAIYIVQGQGFSVVDDLRYDWETGSCLFMPFGSVHQHFNMGEDTVRYFSVTALPLERFAGLAKVMQYQEAGETAIGETEKFKMAEAEIHPEYGRIVLRAKDAPIVSAKEQGAFRAKAGGEFFNSMAKEMRTAGIAGHRSREIQLMWDPRNKFKAREVEITAVLCDEPGMHSGKHAHMEAVLYVLQGEGYSIVDGERIPWKKGTCFHVQGPQTVHEHFNTGNIEAQQLRIHFGLRANYFQPITKRVFPYQYYEYSSYK